MDYFDLEDDGRQPVVGYHGPLEAAFDRHEVSEDGEVAVMLEENYGNGVTRRLVFSECIEGMGYKEEWQKEGVRHRIGGPAVTIFNDHAIPEETYLDEAKQENWVNGKCVSEEDTTYEDIVSKKPLAVQRSVGYDP